MDMTIKRNKKSEFDTGLSKGVKKGMKKGVKKGIKKGFQKGMTKGFEKGRKEEALDIARSLKSLGKMSVEEISDVTGLTVKEIQELDLSRCEV